MTAPDPDLEGLSLGARDWTALGKLADALNEFEPLAKRPGVGPKTVERLIALGLAERGEPSLTWRHRGYDLGFRLTDLGARALDQRLQQRGGPRVRSWIGGGEG